MTPCSSGNSPTMPLTRSALQRCAARIACGGVGAGHVDRDLVGQDLRCARRARPGVPSLAWNTMSFRAGSRSSSRTLRSWSQKNLASDSRERSTRSLPSTIVLPPSRATLLATTTKRLASAPSFLLVDEVALMRLHRDDQHFGRHVHELAIDGAEHRHRPFDQARDLVEQAVVGLAARPAPRRRASRAPASTIFLRSAGSSTTCAALSLAA